MWLLPLARWRWRLLLTGAGNKGNQQRLLKGDGIFAVSFFLRVYWAQNTLKFFSSGWGSVQGEVCPLENGFSHLGFNAVIRILLSVFALLLWHGCFHLAHLEKRLFQNNVSARCGV